MVDTATYYPSPAGDAEFLKLSCELVFGEQDIPATVMGVQTVGGSGALRVCAELLVSQGITRMMLPNPTVSLKCFVWIVILMSFCCVFLNVWVVHCEYALCCS